MGPRAPRILDISQPLGERTAVWPGDRPVELAWTMSRRRGDSVNVAALVLTMHAGTHADGPLHYSDLAPPIGASPLDVYVGAALVIDARGRPVLDETVLDGVRLDGVERILFRTREVVDETEFPPVFAAIAPALAERLGDAGVRLVGTDAPSVDPFDSKTLDAHHALAARGLAILENLVLDDVPAGRYMLVALPLRLVEADSSPVRAVLLEGFDA
jgi:arylformamidase